MRRYEFAAGRFDLKSLLALAAWMDVAEMKAHKYLGGYKGNREFVMGKDSAYAKPLTLKQALRCRKSLDIPKTRVRLYKLVVVREWTNGVKKR